MSGHRRQTPDIDPLPDPPMDHLAAPIVHLDAIRPDGGTSCGVMSKFRTRSASAVTCEDCKQTWDYAALIEHLVENFPRKGKR